MRCIKFLILLSLVGCGPLTVEPTDTTTPDSRFTAKETLFTVLADSIDSADTLPKNTTQLELMLRHLRTLQAITDEQVSAVKSIVDFSKEVELTKSDSDKIRGLK